MQPSAKKTAIEFAPFAMLAEQWQKTRGERMLPDIQDWDFGTHAPLKPFCMQATLSHNPLGVHYGEVGGALEKLYGKPIRGKTLDELYNDFFRRRAYKGYEQMVKTRAPVYDKRSLSTIFKKLGYHRLHIPFGRDARVTHALTYLVPTDKEIKLREDWEGMVKDTPWL